MASLRGIRERNQENHRLPAGLLSFTTVYFYSKSPACQGCWISKMPTHFGRGCGQARQYACGGARAEKRTEDGGKKTEEWRRRMEDSRQDLRTEDGKRSEDGGMRMEDTGYRIEDGRGRTEEA
jgi:hypothetical protein